MPRLHVCSLALVAETVAQTGARSLLTLLSPGTAVVRPMAIAPKRHLYLALSDIVEPMPGQVVPDATHLEDLLGFVRGWDRAEPMVIHCFAGVSRSTAAAYIAACALRPGGDELTIAKALRIASPTASPNSRLIALADDALGRRGRMREAIATIGRGEACFEGTPFALELG
jgi:predicted protein tyrosine phosphatase